MPKRLQPLHILKQFSFTLLLLAITVMASGQITEEKVYPHQVLLATIDSAENAYTYVNVPDATVAIYSLNHKLISKVSLKIPHSHSLVNSTSFYRRVFDQDDGIEHLSIIHNDSLKYRYKILIHDDDGSIMMSFDSIIVSTQIHSTTQGAKLIIRGRYSNHIFRLAGQIPTEKSAPFEESAFEIYPNPAVNSVELAYQLPKHQTTGEIHVYDVKGNLMETISVGNAFKQVYVDISTYPSGLYIAQLNRMEVKKFLVEK